MTACVCQLVSDITQKIMILITFQEVKMFVSTNDCSSDVLNPAMTVDLPKVFDHKLA